MTYVLKGSPRPPTWEPTTAIPVRVRGAGRPDQDGSGGAGERRSGSRHSSKVELTGLTQLECGEGCDGHQGRQGISRRMSRESLNFRCLGPGCRAGFFLCSSPAACPSRPVHSSPPTLFPYRVTDRGQLGPGPREFLNQTDGAVMLHFTARLLGAECLLRTAVPPSFGPAGQGLSSPFRRC